MAGRVHVIGAGLAGLAASIRLSAAGIPVVLYEAAPQAGGRCRTYFDTTLGLAIDNGNHLLLSANHAAREFLKAIGAEDGLHGPEEARFPFFDLASGENWVLRPNDGKLPWWIFDRHRRVPGSRARDYLAPLPLLLSRKDQAIGTLMRCSGPLFDRLWGPVLVAGLNTAPAEGSSRLAAQMIRESLGAGGEACRPLIARNGLSRAFIDPALALLAKKGGEIRFGHRLRALEMGDARIEALHFAEGREGLGRDEKVILAVPAPAAAQVLPGLEVPQNFRAIVNAHFKFSPPPGFPPFLGVIGGLTEWIFAYPDHLSVTISAADRLVDWPRETLASRIWEELRRVIGLDISLPIWQIVKEKRATFAATPAENARRPRAATAFANLALAGDWTQTGLPATIEGAIRSGNAAAAHLLA